MTRYRIFIFLFATAAVLSISCKSKTKVEEDVTETYQENIQIKKKELSDSVLANIDALVLEYRHNSEQAFEFPEFRLSEREKLLKPSYLLDPDEASSFVNRSQKLNALAIYFQEYWVRKLYEMPSIKAKETIAKLAMDVDYPIDMEKYKASVPPSKNITEDYEICKKRGSLADFWQFQNALLTSFQYVLSQDPELYFNKISEEEWANFVNRCNANVKAIRELAGYDDEIALILSQYKRTRVTASDSELERAFASRSSAKQYFLDKQDKFAAKRNALLQ